MSEEHCSVLGVFCVSFYGILFLCVESKGRASASFRKYIVEEIGGFGFSFFFAIPFMEFCLRGWNPKRRVNASCGVDVGIVGAGLGDGGGMMIA